MADSRLERANWLARQVLPHEPGLRRWLGQLSGSVEIDDVVQETYGVLAALDSVSHIRDPRSYLYTTARSILLQQVRRARIVAIESMAEIESLCIHEDAWAADAAQLQRQQLHWLAEQIALLPERCREAFVLRKIHGYSQREIAQQMGIAESTVEKHIGLGLRLLMQAMAEPTASVAPGAGGGSEQPTGALTTRQRQTDP